MTSLNPAKAIESKENYCFNLCSGNLNLIARIAG